jgi:DNA-binding NarL/FixJ family response regulator
MQCRMERFTSEIGRGTAVPDKLPPVISANAKIPHPISLFSENQWRTVAAHLELSARELEIIRLVFEDVQEQAIAEQSGTSLNTIRTQLKRLYWKLGVRSRVGLVLRIVREHLAALREVERREPTLWPGPRTRRAA